MCSAVLCCDDNRLCVVGIVIVVAVVYLQTSLSGALDTIAAAIKQLVCAEHVVSGVLQRVLLSFRAQQVLTRVHTCVCLLC